MASYQLIIHDKAGANIQAGDNWPINYATADAAVNKWINVLFAADLNGYSGHCYTAWEVDNAAELKTKLANAPNGTQLHYADLGTPPLFGNGIDCYFTKIA